MVATKKGMVKALAIAIDGSCEIANYSQVTLLGAIERLHGPAVEAGRLRPDVSAEDVVQTVIGMCLARRDDRWEAAVARLSDVFLDGLCAAAAKDGPDAEAVTGESVEPGR